MGQRTNWAVGLLGAYSCSIKFLFSNGSHGISLRYKAAGHSRRVLHMTDSFKVAYPLLVDIIERCASHWELVDEATLVRIKGSYNTRQSELYVLVAAGERPACLAGIKYVLAEPLGRALIAVIVPHLRRIGVCDRMQNNSIENKLK